MKHIAQVLIVKRMPVIHNEFKSLLDEDREEDLGRMYKLMHRTGIQCLSGGYVFYRAVRYLFIFFSQQRSGLKVCCSESEARVSRFVHNEGMLC